LQLEAKETGTDFESLQGSIKKLGINIAESLGGGEKFRYFRDLGLDVAALMNMNPAQQFTSVGEAIAHLENPTSRVHYAFELLGKSGAEAMNVLMQGAEGLEEAKQKMGIVSDADIEQIHQAHSAMIDMDVAGQKLARTFAVELAPAISGVIGVISHEIKAASEELLALNHAADHALGGHQYDKQWIWGNGDGIDNTADFERHHNAALKAAGHVPTPEELEAEDAERKAEKPEDAEFARQMQEAQGIRERTDPYEKYHREASNLSGLLDSGTLSADEFGDALSDAARRFQDEMERRDPLKKLREEADKLFDDARTPLEQFADKIEHIRDIFQQLGYSDEAAQGVIDHEADKFRKSQGLDHPHDEQHEARFAAGHEADSAEGYSQILKSTQPKVDEYAKKQADLQQKSLDTEKQIVSVLQTISQNIAPAQVVTIGP